MAVAYTDRNRWRKSSSIAAARKTVSSPVIFSVWLWCISLQSSISCKAQLPFDVGDIFQQETIKRWARKPLRAAYQNGYCYQNTNCHHLYLSIVHMPAVFGRFTGKWCVCRQTYTVHFVWMLYRFDVQNTRQMKAFMLWWYHGAFLENQKPKRSIKHFDWSMRLRKLMEGLTLYWDRKEIVRIVLSTCRFCKCTEWQTAQHVVW